MGCLPGQLPRCLRPQLDHKAWDATLAQTITEAVARKMAKAHAHYQAILNERGTATLQTSLKVSSGANGFKVMYPFYWTKNKSIYQRWQLWSEKTRLTLDAMEGGQGSITSGEFHSHIVKIAKRCKFPNPEAEERAIRDAIFLGLNSQRARDKAINLMNEEAKELKHSIVATLVGILVTGSYWI